mgnify:CR=1 FL=1
MCTPTGIKFMFVILSGVLQGCPLSGSLFVMAIDPLLHMFRIKLEDSALGMVCACADDIGIALKVAEALPFLFETFEKFRSASGLTLKPSKSFIVLTVCHCSENNKAVFKEYLYLICPAWVDMNLVDSAKYLRVSWGLRLVLLSGPRP